MKKQIITLTLLLAQVVALGMPTFPFYDWEMLKRGSSDIIIAKCTETPDDPVQFTRVRNLVPSDIRIIAGWKKDEKNQMAVRQGRASEIWTASTNLGPAVIESFPMSFRPVPVKGEYYLVFAQSEGDKRYKAVESYRFIPLGHTFPDLAGRSLDEDLQTVFKWRLDHLNQELQEAQEEKQRIEAGIKK